MEFGWHVIYKSKPLKHPVMSWHLQDSWLDKNLRVDLNLGEKKIENFGQNQCNSGTKSQPHMPDEMESAQDSVFRSVCSGLRKAAAAVVQKRSFWLGFQFISIASASEA